MEKGAENPQLEDLEIALLLEAVYRHYGYDFRDYASSSIKRRIMDRVTAEQLVTISALQDKVLHDPTCMERLLTSFSVHVTSMFRDPSFYLSFRLQVAPVLRTYPFVRIWHAGCATGEEVYSMAILLHEEGLYDRCRLYATDMNEKALVTAREGIFPLSDMQEHTGNYLKAGGKQSFSEYYTAGYDHAVFRTWLRENIVFAHHNLVVDSSFNEFNVIVCRNVLIYFNRTLQARVHKLLFDSLSMFGVLALGRKETLKFSPHESQFEPVSDAERIYRRVR
jgi:chemotaxis protein methyltransferase CheR